MGTRLENGVYLPEISETPWGEEMNNNLSILSETDEANKAELQRKINEKVSLVSDTPQTVQSDIIITGNLITTQVIDGSINHALRADLATNASSAVTATSAGYATNANHADSSDSALYADSAGTADNANHAIEADTANIAKYDQDGNEIATTYLKVNSYDNSSGQQALELANSHIGNASIHTSSEERTAINNALNTLADRCDTEDDNISANASEIASLHTDIANLPNSYMTLETEQIITGKKTFTNLVCDLTGNSNTATVLATTRKINDTNFNGSADITTVKWGVPRKLTVSDYNNAHTGLYVLIDGSADVDVQLPSTINAEILGNATTATTLKNTRKINDTNFDGSADITTAKWGTARTINVVDYNNSHQGSLTTVDGSSNYSLALPSTISAEIDGNASTASTLKTSVSINGTSFNGSAGITTAKWGNTRQLTISDVTSSNTGAVTQVDGSSNINIKLPATINAEINGNATTADNFSSAKTISLTGAVTGSVSSIGGWTIPTTLSNIDASKITTGTIDIARLPAGAIERLVIVDNQAARFALTASNVQLGDTVKQADTGAMYFVTDTTKLNKAAGYTEYTAGSATSVPWSGVTGKPTFANVATSGSYNDLTNKPSFASVATSGSYNDLTNKPTIPTVNNATLTIQKNGSKVQTFTANASSDVTCNITVPTKTSELNNDSGFLTSHQSLSNYLTKLTNVSEMGRHIDLHYDNDTAAYNYDVRLYVSEQGSATGKGDFSIVANAAYAPAPASDANDTRIATTKWVKDRGYLTSTVAIANGGTGATSVSAAVKNLFNTDVGENFTSILGITSQFGSAGYIGKNKFLSKMTMTGASSSSNGTAGFVPVPSSGSQDKFLRANGTWANVGAVTDNRRMRLIASRTTPGSFTFNCTEHALCYVYFVFKFKSNTSGKISIPTRVSSTDTGSAAILAVNRRLYCSMFTSATFWSGNGETTILQHNSSNTSETARFEAIIMPFDNNNTGTECNVTIQLDYESSAVDLSVGVYQ